MWQFAKGLVKCPSCWGFRLMGKGTVYLLQIAGVGTECLLGAKQALC